MSNTDKLKLLFIVLLLLFAVNFKGEQAPINDSLSAISERITDSVSKNPEARMVFGLDCDDVTIA